MICCLRFSLRHSNLCRLSHRYMYIRTYGYINPNLYAHQKQASQRRHIAYLLKQSQIAQLCIMQFAQKLDKHIHTYRCVYSVDFHLSVLSYPKAFPPTFQPSTPSSSPAVFPVCASFSKFSQPLHVIYIVFIAQKSVVVAAVAVTSCQQSFSSGHRQCICQFFN